MAVEKKLFGRSPEGQEIYQYVLSNKNGMKAVMTNLGAVLVNLWVPDKNAVVEDVVLGFDKAEDYYKNPCYFGGIIGPNCNRITGATFEIDGNTYQLDASDNGNNLHSHKDRGYHKRLWDASAEENSVTFTLEDVDGNMGFPGNKKIEVTYSLSEENELKLHYHGCSDKKTIINLTNHSYFNLDGHNGGSIEEHTLWMNAAYYTPIKEGNIPTGEIVSVKDTPMDFTEGKKIGREINDNFEQLRLAGGYDHNWLVNDWNGELRLFAKVTAPRSGRVMTAYTTLPGFHLYTGNFIEPQNGKDGAYYSERHGFALETQYYPDAIHHDNFPSCVFGGDGAEYDSVTVFKFE